MTTLIGNEVWSNEPKRTQVYLATHNEEGNRLPHMNRSFISFSFGGKPIEDFNLIATFNDRLEKNVYAEFEDSTSDYETLDGQYFWGTHFKPNQLNFTLATDGITQQELDSFKKYFMPGIEKELILSEHPNRAILARVSTAPSVSLLPFEEQITVFNTQISTTVYKGTINLSFIMDEPFWYGKMNYIPAYVDQNDSLSFNTKESATNASENKIYTLQDKEYLKVFLEDGVPFEQQLVNNSIFLGNNILMISNEDDWTKNNYINLSSQDSAGVQINADTPQYLFYSGTAPSKPTIQFNMTPLVVGEIEPLYIDIDDTDLQKLAYDKGILYGEADSPQSLQYQLVDGILKTTQENLVIGTDGRIKKQVNITGDLPIIINPIGFDEHGDVQIDLNKYSYIAIKTPSNEIDYFYFTTPGLWTGYNQAIKIINDCKNGEDLLKLKERLRDELKEYYSRAWALKTVEEQLSIMTNTIMNDNVRVNLFNNMKDFLKAGENDEITSATFTFNSATGEAIGKFYCMDAKTNKSIQIEENVGDMVKSSYLLIKEKSNFNAINQIDKETCYEITSNENLENFKILYKNMYL